jgi:hypothetical protein
MNRVFIVIVIGVVLVGCGKHYWNKPGAGFTDFARDSGDCAQANAMTMGGDKNYGIVRLDFYRACLRGRGWVRAQLQEPLPPEWFRGFEDDNMVRLDAPPPQPYSAHAAPVSSVSNAPPPSEPTLAALTGTWAGTLTGPGPGPMGRRVYPATLRIGEEGNQLRWSLEVSEGGLGGSGLVVRTEDGASLSGRFGAPAAPISFSVTRTGSTLEANGLGADNWVYRLVLQRKR